jgi:hypothetical protein
LQVGFCCLNCGLDTLDATERQKREEKKTKKEWGERRETGGEPNQNPERKKANTMKKRKKKKRQRKPNRAFQFESGNGDSRFARTLELGNSKSTLKIRCGVR